MKVTILGCGGSGGVPLIGPNWGKCDPAEPKNRRRRVSVLIAEGDLRIVIDTSPDFRAQALDAGLTHLDAILYTHDHADHSQGIDDVRFIRPGKSLPPGDARIPVHGDAATLASLMRRFDYAFRQGETGAGPLYKPFLRAIPIDGPFDIGGLPVTSFPQDHGFGTETLGYRIGHMAYSTDCVGLPEESLAKLGGLDLWIVDCLRFEPHATHAHFAQALAWAAALKPKLTILTHMNHTVDYETIRGLCPPGVVPAYDGLTIDLPDSRPGTAQHG